MRVSDSRWGQGFDDHLDTVGTDVGPHGDYSGLEGLIVEKRGEAGDRSQRPSAPRVWLPSPLNTNALECN